MCGPSVRVCLVVHGSRGPVVAGRGGPLAAPPGGGAHHHATEFVGVVEPLERHPVDAVTVRPVGGPVVPPVQVGLQVLNFNIKKNMN